MAAADRVRRRLRVDAGPGARGGDLGARTSRNTARGLEADGALRLRRIRSERDQVRDLLLAHRHQILSRDRFARARARLRRARSGGHGDPDLAPGSLPALGEDDGGNDGSERAALARLTVALARIVR